MDRHSAAEVAPGVWQLEQPLDHEVSLYLHLVVGSGGAALVDGGLPDSAAAVDALMAAAGVHDSDLRFLLNTHAHHDHIGTFAALRSRTGANVVAARGAVRWIEDLDINLREFALHRPDVIPDTPALRAELAPTYGQACAVDLTVTEGSTVRLGDATVVEAFELAGHVRAELGWLERSSRTLILGDIVTGIDWSFFHGHLLPTQFRRSLHKLRAMMTAEQVDLVCMSHYSPRGPDEFVALLGEVERYLDRVTDVIEGRLDATPRSLTEIWRHTCTAMGRVEEFRGLAMVEAHLREAVAAGRARSVGPDLYTGVASSHPSTPTRREDI
ncbi:MAG TPA: MBL fold metallo-hydrolase [Actinoplanes sp.]